MNSFAFMTATAIVFGRGTTAGAARRAVSMGHHIFVLYSAKVLRPDWLGAALHDQVCTVHAFRWAKSLRPNFSLPRSLPPGGQRWSCPSVAVLSSTSARWWPQW